MQKYKTFLFRQEAFDNMPFGYSVSASRMTYYADVVVEDNKVIKHPASIHGCLTPSELIELKNSWVGVIVTAPCL